MLTTKERRNKMREILNDTVEYYSADLTRRAFTFTNGGGCQYLTEDGRKCAVGRLLHPEDLELAKDANCTVYDVFDNFLTKDGRIPKSEIFTELSIHFFRRLQYLHDMSLYWNSVGGGLSKSGKEYVDIFYEEITIGVFDNF